jgi:hypothetical protein
MEKQVMRVKKIQLLEKRGDYEIIVAGEERHDIIKIGLSGVL